MLFNDDPLAGHDNQDFFEHGKLAQKISLLFKSSKTPPPNLAIYGPWGSGKSSLLYLVEAELNKLRENQRPLWITFDAWAYQNEDSLVIAMLARLFEEAKEPFKDSFWKIIKASALSLADIALKVASADKMSSEAIQKNLELAEGSKPYESKHVVIKQQFEQVISKLSTIGGKAHARKVILAIDNLDRCKPDTAIRVLETLFLVSNITNCTLVIAVDQHVLMSFLNRFYQGTSFNGARYLEKIFPISYRIPDPWVWWSYEEAVDSVYHLDGEGADVPEKDGTTNRLYYAPDQVFKFLSELLTGTRWDDRKTPDEKDENTIFAMVWHYLSQPRILRNPRRIKRVVRFIHAYDPEDVETAECTLFLVIISDIWPEVFEYFLTAAEDTWADWIDYLAGLKVTSPDDSAPSADSGLRDFLRQIRKLYDGEAPKYVPTFRENCPIRRSESLMVHLANLREMGL